MKSIREIEQMTDYLRDESRSTGIAEAVFFPESEEDVVRIMWQYPDVPITVQGSRTGLTAGCVPEGGIVLNMSRMNQILEFRDEAAPGGARSSAPPPGCGIVRVQPGLALQTLREALQGGGRWFPPDPTETSASIGGMIANDSSGARTYKYGSMREHVCALRVVLRDGSVLRLRRGENFVNGLEFVLKTEGRGGRVLRGRLPDIPMLRVSKNVAGYYIRPDMDLLDLFIGSEGTLGIVTEAELVLQPRPKQVWGCMVFLRTEEQALAFVEAIRGRSVYCGSPGMAQGGVSPAPPDTPQAEAIEYFDGDVLELMRQAQEAGEMLQGTVSVPAERCAVYVEYAGATREEMLRTFTTVYRSILDLEGDAAETWLAAGGSDLNKLKEFRHAAPVCVNHVIAETKKKYPGITKLGTDMSVPDGCLGDAFRMYRAGLAGGIPAQAEGSAQPADPVRPFRAAVFGHIGNNHVHVNILPRDMEEYQRGKALYTEWARRIVAMGGSVSAEHGIGKLKKWLLAEMYDEEQREQMRALRRVFDPGETLGKGNIL